MRRSRLCNGYFTLVAILLLEYDLQQKQHQSEVDDDAYVRISHHDSRVLEALDVDDQDRWQSLKTEPLFTTLLRFAPVAHDFVVTVKNLKDAVISLTNIKRYIDLALLFQQDCSTFLRCSTNTLHVRSLFRP